MSTQELTQGVIYQKEVNQDRIDLQKFADKLGRVRLPNNVRTEKAKEALADIAIRIGELRDFINNEIKQVK